MPYAAATPCRKPGCPTLVKRPGLCEIHQAEQYRTENQRRKSAPGHEIDSQYKTARWRHLRAHVVREEPLCRLCERAGRVSATVLVDHIVPVKQGGPMWERSNLQGLCNACHEAKSASEGSRFAMR
jgi:5-methylcytosine-specific restriction enzyme A